MILADKIIMLRKQNGWSQEDLAMKMNVSRQSVSKWESMTSVPDLNKIIKMSELFGVSTDYLLKDEIEEMEQEAIECYDSEQEKAVAVSLEEASGFMDNERSTARRIAGGVALCILSPIPLIILSGASRLQLGGISEGQSIVIGPIVLIVMVALAVALFITTGMRNSRYEYLEKETLSLNYGAEGVVEKRKEEFEPVFRKSLTGGVVLCILSVLPLLGVAVITESEFAVLCCVGVLMAIVAIGVYLIVWSAIIRSSYQKLLQEGEYTPEQKQENKKNDNLSKIYWCTATALYLALSFITGRWDVTWIVWPCAGVFYAAVCGIASSIRKRK